MLDGVNKNVPNANGCATRHSRIQTDRVYANFNAWLFGWGKHDDRLNADAVPPTDTEIAELVARYQKFKESFGFTEAIAPRISYVIVPTAVSVDLSNLKRWYELADDAIVGDYVIYRATPRGASSE